MSKQFAGPPPSSLYSNEREEPYMGSQHGGLRGCCREGVAGGDHMHGSLQLATRVWTQVEMLWHATNWVRVYLATDYGFISWDVLNQSMQIICMHYIM